MGFFPFGIILVTYFDIHNKEAVAMAEMSSYKYRNSHYKNKMEWYGFILIIWIPLLGKKVFLTETEPSVSHLPC